MNAARVIRLVAEREIRERVRSKAFIAATIVMLLLVGGTTALQGALSKARTYRVAGKLPVDDLNAATGLAISNEAYDTVGGWVLDLFGRVPRRGERVETPDLSVTVEKIERTRVVEVLLSLRTPQPTEKAA